MKLGNAHNETWGARWIRWWGHWGPWEVRARCVECGNGHFTLAEPGQPGRTNGKYQNRVLCPGCGAGWDSHIPWIGRKIHACNVWEWAPVERLPADLRPKGVETDFDRAVKAAVEAELPKRLDAEFAARVAAAVETELAARAASSQRGDGEDRP